MNGNILPADFRLDSIADKIASVLLCYSPSGVQAAQKLAL